ncbi:immunoglobulin lambda-1 light chain-like [Rhincodon typus]|uniref:immunoglobulin lambda-1 light chain-like n=1 Tax=Rhincodon typus TaxID=259920 RepID=UPI0020304099|nr:immunoglobulin lambda-1 light chain-like [Rhincodon typus]
MNVFHPLAVFLCFLAGSTSNPVLRQPLSASVPAGGTATLTCQVTNLNIADYGGFWYQLRKGQKPRWVLVHWASGQVDRGTGYTDRYLPYRDSATSSYVLTISSISEADTGTYYCATVKDNMVFFGNGIHLLIPSRQLSPPTIHLYPPPAEQLNCKDSNLTLTCLANGFYPGHVRARWTMDGEEVGRHLVTEAVPQEEEEEGGKAQGTGGSYSWSSYLTMSAKDWHAHSRFSCQLEHESSGEPLVAVVDRESCPLS